MQDEVVNVTELQAEIAPLVSKEIAVTNNEQHANAVAYIKANKTAQDHIRAKLAPVVESAHRAHKNAVALRDSLIKPLAERENEARKAVQTYLVAEERKRAAEQARLQAEADEKARKEREKLAAMIAKAEAKNNIEKAQALAEKAAMIESPVIAVASTVPNVGTALIKRWKSRVIDAAKVPREWLVVNEDALNSFARSTKGQVPVAGVEFYEDTTIQVRR